MLWPDACKAGKGERACLLVYKHACACQCVGVRRTDHVGFGSVYPQNLSPLPELGLVTNSPMGHVVVRPVGRSLGRRDVLPLPADHAQSAEVPLAAELGAQSDQASREGEGRRAGFHPG